MANITGSLEDPLLCLIRKGMRKDKPMAKVIEVKSCVECPHISTMAGVVTPVCTKTPRPEGIPFPSDPPPSWCPLPDAPEAEKTKEEAIRECRRERIMKHGMLFARTDVCRSCLSAETCSDCPGSPTPEPPADPCAQCGLSMPHQCNTAIRFGREPAGCPRTKMPPGMPEFIPEGQSYDTRIRLAINYLLAEARKRAETS